MKHKKLIFFVASAILSFGIVTPFVLKESKNVIEPDNVRYEEKLTVDYNEPEELYAPAPKKAAVANPNSLVLHYHNDDGKCIPDTDKGYVGREIHMWSAGFNGVYISADAGGTPTDISFTVPFTGDYESLAKKKSLSFIVKYSGGQSTWYMGQSDTVELVYEDYELNDSGALEVWVIPGEGTALEVYKTQRETTMDRFLLATFESWKKIKIIATAVPQTFKLYAFTTNYMRMGTYEQGIKLENYLVAQGSNPTCTDVEYNSVWCKQFELELNYTAHPNIQYCLKGVFPEWTDYTKTKYVSFHNLYNDTRFNTYYNYDGKDLGATYNDATSTTFRVWAPTAARVRLMLYKSGIPESVAELYTDVEGDDGAGMYNMAFRPGGIWEVTVRGQDLKNHYYNYQVINSLGVNEVIDPYAKGCGVNGDRGMVVNWAETNPDGWDNVPQVWNTDSTIRGASAKVGNKTEYNITTPQELSIYETHIRDLTMDSSWTGSSMRGTYTAFVEPNTKLSDGVTPTGFSHLTSLGVKAVQLEPVYDQDNNEDYGTPAPENPNSSRRVNNWGYNPKNYNCVEGSYAIDPYNGESRITEFKKMVQAFATNGNHTRVIMDVVYNHVSGASGSCFSKLMPRYYFRHTEDGAYYDGSGCGNEVKSEAPMMRKYIVDSLCFWASEYKIKGFRFDLMALIDVGTIDAARRALYEVDPDIYIYGEGWTGDGSGYSYTDDYGNWLGWSWQVHGNQDLHDDDTPSHNNLTEDQIKLLGCTRSSVYRYLYPVANACLVGTFNDSGRNSLKGENNAGSTGYLSGNLGDNGNNTTAVADMMAGYANRYGGNPLQCVNYASCHDNYTLFDQFSLVGATSDVGMSCAATVAAECAVLFSNGVAFIHGGEELFRTKEVKTPEDLELSVLDTRVWRESTNSWVSHNSYNLSDDVNAYKWDRLKMVGSTNVTTYTKAIKDAIALRNEMATANASGTKTFYTAEDFATAHPYLYGSPLNVWTNAGRQDPDPQGKEWPKWAGATVIGIYNGGIGATCLLSSLTGSAFSIAAGQPVSMKVNSNPFATVSYSAGNVSMGGAHCITYK